MTAPRAFDASRLAFEPIVTAATYVVPLTRNFSHSKTGKGGPGEPPSSQPTWCDPSGQGNGSGGSSAFSWVSAWSRSGVMTTPTPPDGSTAPLISKVLPFWGRIVGRGSLTLDS